MGTELCILPPYDEKEVRVIRKYKHKLSGKPRYQVQIKYWNGKIKAKNYARYKMETYLGEFLPDSVDVHHKDGNQLNDKISNLECLDCREHTIKHNLVYNEPFKTICLVCGKIFTLPPKILTQVKNNLNRGKFCSLSCASRSQWPQYANQIKENTRKREKFLKDQNQVYSGGRRNYRIEPLHRR